MANDPIKQLLADHQTWVNHLQPVGLVVSPRALAEAGVPPQHPYQAEAQAALRLLLKLDEQEEPAPIFGRNLVGPVLGWEATDWVTTGLESLGVPLREYDEVLLPTAAVPDPDAPGRWLMLVQELAPGCSFDARSDDDAPGWPASPQVRMERLLREAGVAIGVLLNGHQLRLVYAPSGETSGHLTWDLIAITTVAGRPMLGGLWALLGANALFTGGAPERLVNLLASSRRYQSDVSNALAGQVYEALAALLNGFQQADALAGGALLGPVLATDPQEVYGGLLSTMMRLVFLLYAEERELMPQGSLYQQNYSVTGLFSQLRADGAAFPDLMDSRYGAWPRLLALFHLVHDGCAHPALTLPARRGRLFDPDSYPFLEGRHGPRNPAEPLATPRVPDSAVLKMLEKLIVLDGERLSYRALDVEQIGAVYEAMMGFEVKRATGRALPLALRVRKQRLVVVADVDHLLGLPAGNRANRLKEELGITAGGQAGAALRGAATPEDVAAALARRVPPGMHLLPPGSLYLQPTPRRRQTGSHYTPASLTSPIVATTLRPILDSLGPRPTAERLLALRVCDPAMGSGAFLVQVCRVLADRVVRAWTDHGEQPEIPADEDPVLFARRLVAQRCLYGVDLNPFAVDLAKLSLWLVTLAREHPFTFLDHALVYGDALCGLLEPQLRRMDWQMGVSMPINQLLVDRALETARAERREIHRLADEDSTDKKIKKLEMARAATAGLAAAANGVVAAFFSADKDKARRKALSAHQTRWAAYTTGQSATLEAEAPPLPALHWALAFPEVFDGHHPGFDAIVGNPPFMGKNPLIQSHPEGYLDWLQAVHPGSHGNADLVAHFFRRAYALLRPGGTMGLIATNTLAQGDTRATGLTVLLAAGGTIFEATRRRVWPGDAAVVVSVVHVCRGRYAGPVLLDGHAVERISAYLTPGMLDTDPAALKENEGQAFVGSYVLGMGFTFDDTNPAATPLAEMERLIAENLANREVVFPYIGGEELNDDPAHMHRRYVINFESRSEAEVRARWPELMAIVEEKVKPKRLTQGSIVNPARWWMFARSAADLSASLRDIRYCLAVCRVSQHHLIARMPSNLVFAETIIVFPLDTYAALAALQSRVHELWARFFGSSLEERPRYTPTSCFANFPFPPNWIADNYLGIAGNEYEAHRAALMIGNNQGLTATYNRFHDPDDHDPAIVRLRELHDGLDRAMFAAYGWDDLTVSCVWEPLHEAPDESDEGELAGKKRAKVAWRWRWPEALRDEVFSRLLALNSERAAQELATASRTPAPAAPLGPLFSS